MSEPKITVTDETRYIIQAYLEKQQNRRTKRKEKKIKPVKDVYDPLKRKTE